jgi:GNAT superfamily N-acetyltransferase
MRYAQSPLSKVEPISELHDPSRFDCGGHESLDDWLKRFALANQRNDSARTYVVHRNGFVAGYYSIAAGSISVEEAPSRISKGLARHPIPVILLARLAVHKNEHGTGLGKALLKEALARIAQAADIVGARAVLVHAIDEQAKAFYRHFDFEPSPGQEMELMLLMKDLRKTLEAGSNLGGRE